MSLDPDELRRRLDDAVGAFPATVPDLAPLQAAGRRRRRNRRIASSGGVALTIAVVGALVATGPWGATAQKPPPLGHPSAPVISSPTAVPASAAASASVAVVAPPSDLPDPNAPVRIGYATMTGVWIATFDPHTGAHIGKPVRVSDAFPSTVGARDLQFSPQGRYLVWTQYDLASGYGTTYGLYDGETGRHVVVQAQGMDGGVPVTATGTGAVVFDGTTGTAIDRDGKETRIPGATLDGAALNVDEPGTTGLSVQLLGTYAGGLLATDDASLIRLPADGTATRVAVGTGFDLAAGGPDGTTVWAHNPSGTCNTATPSEWRVVQPDGTVSTVVFDRHPGRRTVSVSISPDGTVGGVVADCVNGAEGPTSFIELDGVIARTTTTNVRAEARGPDDFLAEIRGNQESSDGSNLRIYGPTGLLAGDLGGVDPAAGSFAFAPPHLP